MTARRSIPRPYHYKQLLTNLLIGSIGLTMTAGFNQAIMSLLGHFGVYWAILRGPLWSVFPRHIA